jgi:hypothetical protein
LSNIGAVLCVSIQVTALLNKHFKWKSSVYERKMSGDPPTERLISVDIEVEGATAAGATTTTPDKAKDNRSVVGKKAVGGGEVNGNCILDEGFDSIQTYQGYSSA